MRTACDQRDVFAGQCQLHAKRIAGGAAVGAHKTSMLQDLELGRPMEIDALVTVVQELGRLVDVPMPTIDVVLALIQQRASIAGTY